MVRSTGVLAFCVVLLAACTSGTHGTGSGSPAAAQLTPTVTTSTPRATRTPARATSAPPATSRTTSDAPATGALPLGYPTGDATQVITATGPSLGSTSGTLQTWQKVAGGWQKVGPATRAWFGSYGLTEHMSESVSGTPVGSYTLTQAFGSQPNPGTGLPYFRTTPADWWISKTTAPDAALYNTHQQCTSSCPFDTAAQPDGDPASGNPNERLYYSQPYYRYAVVVDYNTRNAPGGVRVGAGSAVFLHVTVNAPTEGCISIDESRLVAIMRWLTPSAHPRILIGV